jgi:hypothetical protein
MDLRILLKTAVMLGLIVAGRFARDAEQMNPGRSISEIIKKPTTAQRVAPQQVARRAAVTPVSFRRPLANSQTASFAEIN